MSMFPGAGARIFKNEVGEPIGWDYPEYNPDPSQLVDDWYEDDAAWDEDEGLDEE